jgi:hypothetical protein
MHRGKALAGTWNTSGEMVRRTRHHVMVAKVHRNAGTSSCILRRNSWCKPMLIRLGLGIGVAVFTAASAWNNWEHLKAYGLAIGLMIIAAEVFKLLCPIALIQHAENHATFQWCATLGMWLVVVVFSFVNTFGNTLLRHAKVKEGTAIEARDVTRPEHVIMREMAGLRQCPALQKEREEQQQIVVKGKPSTKQVKVRYEQADSICEQQRAADQLSLTAEMTESRRRQGIGRDVSVSQHTVTDGYILVAGMLNISVRRHEMDVLTVLLWTLLCEVGSAFGGLAIPIAKKNGVN